LKYNGKIQNSSRTSAHYFSEEYEYKKKNFYTLAQRINYKF